jgi:CRISPR-associated exonuclease Cas4
MFEEDELLPISGIQHLLFCPRQCSLIHVERVWKENLFTIEGHILHKRVHESDIEVSSSSRIERGIPMRSLVYGLIGKADVVEFHYKDGKLVNVVPVEYKRGRPKKDYIDEAQLCAQALCLEEMLGIPISHAFLFYGKNRRRTKVYFDDILRKNTIKAITNYHRIINSRETPKPVYTSKCRRCSLYELCMPKSKYPVRGVASYLNHEISKAMNEQRGEK